MQKPKTMVGVFLALAAGVLAIGGLSASNMGFKIVYPLLGSTAQSSGVNALGLPYVPKPGIGMASDLFADLTEQGIGVQNLQRWLPASDTFTLYGFGSSDFPLVAGEGYFVKVSADASYRIVGSHDAAISVELLGPEHPQSLSGTQLVSLPYHGTSSTASELFAEIGPENVINIQKFLPATETYALYGFGSTDFTITRGEAVFVKAARTVAFVPSHY